MNDYQFKIVRVQGEFIWHSHAETDEAFLVLDGELRIDFRDGHALLRQGELYVVPKGTEHKPSAEREARLMLIEPRGVLNTGEEGGERTADRKSTRLNSSHLVISYAVFCLKKKKNSNARIWPFRHTSTMHYSGGGAATCAAADTCVRVEQ